MNLNQVTVSVTDLSAAEKFYTLLGLEPIVKDEGYMRFTTPVGDSTFSIVEGSAVSPGSAVIYLEVSDVDEEYRRLTGQGTKFIDEPTTKRWGGGKFT